MSLGKQNQSLVIVCVIQVLCSLAIAFFLRSGEPDSVLGSEPVQISTNDVLALPELPVEPEKVETPYIERYLDFSASFVSGRWRLLLGRVVYSVGDVSPYGRIMSIAADGVMVRRFCGQIIVLLPLETAVNEGSDNASL